MAGNSKSKGTIVLLIHGSDKFIPGYAYKVLGIAFNKLGYNTEKIYIDNSFIRTDDEIEVSYNNIDDIICILSHNLKNQEIVFIDSNGRHPAKNNNKIIIISWIDTLYNKVENLYELPTNTVLLWSDGANVELTKNIIKINTLRNQFLPVYAFVENIGNENIPIEKRDIDILFSGRFNLGKNIY